MRQDPREAQVHKQRLRARARWRSLLESREENMKFPESEFLLNRSFMQKFLQYLFILFYFLANKLVPLNLFLT